MYNKPKVGDKVYCEIRKEVVEFEVAKVGRTYFYTKPKHYRDKKISIDNWVEVYAYGSGNCFFPSIDAIEEEKRFYDLARKIRDKFRYGVSTRNSEFSLRDVIKVAKLLGIEEEND